MQGGDEEHSAGKGMRRHHPMMRVGIGGDAAALGKAARPGEVELNDIDRATADQLAEAVEAELSLVTGDRSSERGGDRSAAVDVVGRDRLLDPVELMALHPPPHPDRNPRAPATVAVAIQLPFRPHALTN